jgi:hypothetical protein
VLAPAGAKDQDFHFETPFALEGESRQSPKPYGPERGGEKSTMKRDTSDSRIWKSMQARIPLYFV